MSEAQLARGLSGVCLALSCWVLWVVLRDASDAYANYLRWSDGSIAGAALVVVAAATSVFASLGVAVSVGRQRRAWWQWLLCLYMLVAIGGLPSLALTATVLLWWGAKRLYAVS